MSTPCRGIIGAILGHTFVSVRGGFVHTSSYCFRCGMPKGGWAK